MYTAKLFLQAYQIEQTQIEIDNTGILLGRADQALFNEVEKYTQILDFLELTHHTVHSCAKTPSYVSIQCSLEDQGIEAKLIHLFEVFSSKIELGWKRNGFEAQMRLKNIGNLQRNLYPPWESWNCGICGKKRGWKLSEKEWKTATLNGGKEGVKSLDLLLIKKQHGFKGSAQWEYQLKSKN